MCVEVFVGELGLLFFVVCFDSFVLFYFGEMVINICKIFEFVCCQFCVFFFDEFDVLVCLWEEVIEIGELCCVVNSFLMFIEQIESGGFLIVVMNFVDQFDLVIWWRFDEVVWFDLFDVWMIKVYLCYVFCNVEVFIDLMFYVECLIGSFYVELVWII